MLDHHDTRMWADHGHDFAEWASRAASKALLPFQRLNAIQFDAPWLRGLHRSRHPGQA